MKGKRGKSREAVLKGLYEWRVAGMDAAAIAAHLEQEGAFDQADVSYFSILLEGTIGDAERLKEALQAYLDRPFAELSPVEASILLMGAYELMHQADIPYRVVINEAVELAKRYGGTDGHKYVNGVLDKFAASARSSEFGKSS